MAIVIILAGVGYFGYKNLYTRPSALQVITDTSTWKTYTNTTYNFSVKYPSNLNLTPQEVDIQKNYQEYVNKCNNGTYDGCGGSQWPDYEITFFRPNGKSAFDIDIWKGDVSKYLGGIARNNFTYKVSVNRMFGEDGTIDPIDTMTVQSIFATLSFPASK